MRHGVHIDDEIYDVGVPITTLLKAYGISHVSVNEKQGIHDRSWEMAAALGAMSGKKQFATGTVEAYRNGKVTFGKIQGLDNKIHSYGGMRLKTVT